MKTRPEPRRRFSGFTLVELLVVISIIAVLAALSLTAIRTVSNNRKKLESQTYASSLSMAIDGFYRTYGRLPDIGASGDVSQTEGEPGQKLLTILTGKEEVGPAMQNKQQTRFFGGNEAKSKNTGGLVYSKGGIPEGLYDASGKAFYVKFDTDSDGEIEDPLKPGHIIHDRVVIVYSYGVDGKPGTPDDVRTW